MFYNYELSKNLISLLTKSSAQDIVYLETAYSTLDGLIEKIKNNHESRLLIIGWDYNLDFHEKIDQWLDTVNTRYPVVILEEDIISSCAKYKNLKTIKFTVDAMSNLELIVLYNYMILPEYPESGPWLLLGRRTNEFRDYVAQNLTPLIKDNVIATYGKENFIGNYNLYDNTAPSTLTNLNNLISLQNVYNQTCGSIVLETSPVQNTITEKTLHAIVNEHPFLMLASKGTVQYLRNAGFDMFDDIFDHSYDTIDDYKERFNYAIHSNLNLLLGNIDRTGLSARLKQNRQHLFEFYNSCGRNFVQEIKSVWNS
jgi:hypothetical protein